LKINDMAHDRALFFKCSLLLPFHHTHIFLLKMF
jgi:hypothetical protein